MAKTQKFYVVWKGREPGIYDNWNDAKKQIDKFEGARYKSFTSEDEAKEAFSKEPKPLPAFLTHKATTEKPPTPTRVTRSIAVDAACSGNPGAMEYRGVSLWDNREIFHRKFSLGTNNIGEFLAIVEGIARLQQLNANDIIVYSDSMTAIGWVRKAKCNTKLQYTPRTAELMDLVKRAELWLKNNTFSNPIIKWPTEQWGEIPADFGRKG